MVLEPLFIESNTEHCFRALRRVPCALRGVRVSLDGHIIPRNPAGRIIRETCRV